MKKIRNLFTMLLTVLYFMTVSAGAQSYVPSPTPGRPVIVTPEGISDILVVTPYEYRHEINQQYKVDHFDTADADLTQEAIYRAVEPYMSEDMNKDYLAVVSHWYVHEKEDTGLIHPPVTITVSTALDFGRGYEDENISLAASAATGATLSLLQNFVPSDDSVTRLASFSRQNTFFHLLHYDNGVWSRIPASFHADGSITFTVNTFGAYAIISYEVQEEPPHHPDRPQHSGGSGSGTPHSPQTGEKDPFALLPPVLAAALLGILIAKKTKVSVK